MLVDFDQEHLTWHFGRQNAIFEFCVQLSSLLQGVIFLHATCFSLCSWHRYPKIRDWCLCCLQQWKRQQDTAWQLYASHIEREAERNIQRSSITLREKHWIQSCKQSCCASQTSAAGCDAWWWCVGCTVLGVPVAMLQAGLWWIEMLLLGVAHGRT